MTNPKPENPPQGTGCMSILLISFCCIVVSGILFFVGRTFLGETGGYYLFYGFVLAGLVVVLTREYLLYRKGKSQ